MSQTWQNADGLYVKFNGAAGTATTVGTYEDPGDGGLTVLEIKGLDLSTLTTVAGATIIADNVVIPKGAVIERVALIATTGATSSGNGTLDIGTVRQDRTTELDFNGILAAVAKTDMDSTNEQHTYIGVGSDGGGAQLGVATTNPSLLTANVNTAVYQTGIVTLRVFYRLNANVLGSANA